jgi:hypothetical protein
VPGLEKNPPVCPRIAVWGRLFSKGDFPSGENVIIVQMFYSCQGVLAKISFEVKLGTRYMVGGFGG